MNEYYKFVNEPLPYAYNALEPYIDQKTMELHHDKHLQTYIDNLNKILNDYPKLQKLSLEELIINAGSFPKEIQVPIKNNAGGVYNHRFYFANLSNDGDQMPSGCLAEYIDWIFGSYDAFQKAFTAAALSVFGSGYAWLVVNEKKRLQIITTANQDTPLPLGLCPVLNIDVWEHAYYLKHYNVRADYIQDWYQVVNWKRANDNFLKCIDAK